MTHAGEEGKARGLTNYEVRVARGPICPHCDLDTFDDWWNDPSMKPGVGLVHFQGRIKCHGCGKFFRVEKHRDGVVVSEKGRAALKGIKG